MATFYTVGAEITNPDQMAYEVNPASFAAGAEEILIFTATKKIALKVVGNLTTNGATIKAVYSKLKDAWRENATLIKYPFPMGPITDEQFEMINGWNWDNTETSGDAVLKTPELLRTGGWSVVNTSGNVTEQWAGVITLGTFVSNTDQAYIQQAATGAGATATNIKLTNPVNQAVQILNDPNGDGSYADGYDYRSYFKIFVREWQKLYAQSSISDIGVTSLTYQAYRFPLTNSADLKVTHTEGDVNTTSPYTNVNITYLRHTGDELYNIRGDWVTATSYVAADVVKGSDGHWYKCILGHTSGASTQPITGGSYATNWSAYEGERLIGATYYPFTIIIDGDTTVASGASGAARVAEIYEKVQYQLRQNSDIDNDATASVIGKTASSLLRFVGDTLVTSKGVYVDSFNTQDTNSITFTTWHNTTLADLPVTFPYVAALTVNFGDNLQNDQFAKYWVFFTSANSNDYGTANAIIVDDKDGIDMAGDVNPAWPTKRSSASHSFNYDSNVQGGRTAGTDAAITAIGIGLSTGQFVKSTGTIQRSTSNAVSLVAALERNYSV